MFIAVYSAFLAWLDDTYARDVVGLDSFNERFITGREQANEVLDGFDRLLREINLHYNGIQANLILTSSLNFITSIILEFETQGIPVSLYWWMEGWFRVKLTYIISQVSPHARSYTTFLRIMSGICEAYSMFTFPPEVPVKSYVQAVPDLCLCINYFK